MILACFFIGDWRVSDHLSLFPRLSKAARSNFFASRALSKCSNYLPNCLVEKVLKIFSFSIQHTRSFLPLCGHLATYFWARAIAGFQECFSSWWKQKKPQWVRSQTNISTKAFILWSCSKLRRTSHLNAKSHQYQYWLYLCIWEAETNQWQQKLQWISHLHYIKHFSTWLQSKIFQIQRNKHLEVKKRKKFPLYKY